MSLKRIAARLRSLDSSFHVAESAPAAQQEIIKLVVRTQDLVQVKIEVTPVLRGCVFEPEVLSVSGSVEDQYGFAEINVLSFADLYAGKIMAALDRQHPRDLFDVHQLLLENGIDDRLRVALIVYLISHDHSPHTLLDPIRRDISQDFKQNFAGMTGVENLPAVKWRELNLDRSGEGTCEHLLQKLAILL